ncbi:MAG: glyoxalase [Planctomycetota bacterium]|nr:MAG: glyoxalase [Planctomycetota bacterium]
MKSNPFHLAIPVRDIAEAREFYGNKLGLEEGRSDEFWVDYNFYGHQLVVHLNDNMEKDGKSQQCTNPVDSHYVPVPHFGVVLSMDDWKSLAAKLEAMEMEFVVKPYIRFEGEIGEQATLFFLDPSGNALEFKSFKNIDKELFKK